MSKDKVRITFSCDQELRDRLSHQSNKEGIPRSQLIVELLDAALGDEKTGGGMERSPAVNRLLFDMQKRLGELEVWRREIQDWTSSSSDNAANLETTVAELLNTQLTDVDKIDLGKASKKKGIPAPKPKL